MPSDLVCVLAPSSWLGGALPPGLIVSLREAGKQIASVWMHARVKKKCKTCSACWRAVVFTIWQSFGPCYFNKVGLWLLQKVVQVLPVDFGEWRHQTVTWPEEVWSWGGPEGVRAGWGGGQIRAGWGSAHRDVVCRTWWGSYFKEEPFWKFTQSCLPLLLFITDVVIRATT